MRTVGVKALKDKLSYYVRVASQGEEVLISDRDRVVAELVPPRVTRATHVADAALAELVRSGVITPPLLGPSVPPPVPPVASLGEILAGLDADREDR